MRHLALCCLLAGCAHIERASPERELLVTAVSSVRDVGLAKQSASARAIDRAAALYSPSGIAFALDRSRGKPLLKLVNQSVSTGVQAETEPRKPAGARATLKLARTETDLAELRELETVRASAEASGLDLAIAQERADRAVYRAAILQFAQAKSRFDPKLYGILRVVNYHASDDGDSVRVTADVSVTFGTDAVMRKQAQQTPVNEEKEEPEPPEESSR